MATLNDPRGHDHTPAPHPSRPLYVARRLRYAGPQPGPGEIGFARFPSGPVAAVVPTFVSAARLPDHLPLAECQRVEERELLARLADGRLWVARRGLEGPCPRCGHRYRDYPAVRYVADMARTEDAWDGRVYGLGPAERAHAEAFHWQAWWLHDVAGCGVPVAHAITEGQVLAWTDACGPWRRARPGRLG